MVVLVRFELMCDGIKICCFIVWLWGKMVEGEGFEFLNCEEVGYSYLCLVVLLFF